MSNSNNYKVSSIVLVYNGGKLLEKCIDSLVNQTLDDLEIILVNDCSTDDSLSVCRTFERKHENIRVIDKQKNEGLAKSANLGIKHAKGEYIILVDNDDLVPPDAYLKLYNKAKRTGADITVGKANFLIGNHQLEMGDYERNVWEKEMTVSPKEFPQLFHETFYWNKLIKKSFLIENDIKLDEAIKVYSDRKFSHMLMIYANKVSIINDCVYIWRIQEHTRNKSLSMRRNEVWNYIDRINSFESDLDKLTQFYNDYFKILMRRVIIPVSGVVSSQEFEDIYFEKGSKLLQKEFKLLDHPFDNDLNNLDNLFIYLTYKEAKNELKQLLNTNIWLENEIYNENGKSYWDLDLFRNPNFNIPDEIFEIKSMILQFLKIKNLTVNDSEIIFENIELPKHLKIKKGFIEFKGLTRYDEVLEDNIIDFELNKLNYSDKNIFDLKINVEELDKIQRYDIFFKAEYENRRTNLFRISKLCINNIETDGDNLSLIITPKTNISILNQNMENAFKISCDEKRIKILINNNDEIKKYPIIFIRKNSTKEIFKFSLNNERNFYSLKWKFFLDDNADYTLFMKIYDNNGIMNKNINFKLNYLSDFEDMVLYNEFNQKIRIFKTSHENIKITTF